jgi:hypothetical protein
VRYCTHPSRVHRGFTAYVSKASNANCVKHSQFRKTLGTHNISCWRQVYKQIWNGAHDATSLCACSNYQPTPS